MLGCIGLIHGFPTRDEVLKDVSSLDKTYLSFTYKIRKHVYQPESNYLHKNFVRNIQ